ncbi:hypothetical protein Efla_001035 [Eimeria flavescens]
MSRALALTNGITMHPLYAPIATTIANNSSEVISFATEPLQLQCKDHRSFVQPLVSNGVSFDLLVGLGWLQKNNPRVDWDHGSSVLSDSDHCYKWEAVEFHDESIAIHGCTAGQIRPYRAANEAYCDYLSTIQKLPEKAQSQAFPPPVFRFIKTSLTSRKPTTLPPPQNHQHFIPLYPDPEPTQPDKFPLPLIDVLIDKMSNSKMFRRLDLRNGFHQIRMADGDIRLQENAFHLNLGECFFDADCIDVFGLQISPTGVQPLAANVSSFLSMPSTFSPRTAVRRFLVRRIITLISSHISTTAAPLYSLSSNTTPFCWSPPSRSAVANFKYPLANSPILSIFTGSLPTRIKCDASSFGIGAVLEQQHTDGWHPTQFLSRTLPKPETNYPVIDKEWLAVIYALPKGRHYLQQRFCIRTDHKPPDSLLSKSSPQLQDRRKDNVVADLLSRLPEEAETSVTIASARSLQDPVETHFPAAYALALTTPETHAQGALMSDIRRYRAGDPLYVKIHSCLSAPQVQDMVPPRDDNLYFCKTRLYIPKHPVLRTRLVAEYHDSCYAGHLESGRTSEFLSLGFYWPSLSQDVEAYVKSCDICMRTKVTRHPIAPPSSPITAQSRWRTGPLDVIGPFITNSSATPGCNTCILVFMDKLTQIIRLAACAQQLSAEKAATLFIEHVFRHHGLPERLLSDQGPKFISTFWKHVFSAFQTKAINSTPYYPKGNGQVERTNRTIPEGLRAFVNSRKDDWQTYLHLSEFAYNNTVHSATKITSFFVNYGRHPAAIASLLNPQLTQDLFSEIAAAFPDKLHSDIAAAHSFINTANEKVRAPSNASSQQPFVFHTGDSVLLPSRCFRASRKLESPYVGPFKLVKQTTPKIFELEVPPGCANVWNVRHFKSYYMSSEDHQAYRQQTHTHWLLIFPTFMRWTTFRTAGISGTQFTILLTGKAIQILFGN